MLFVVDCDIVRCDVVCVTEYGVVIIGVVYLRVAVGVGVVVVVDVVVVTIPRDHDVHYNDGVTYVDIAGYTGTSIVCSVTVYIVSVAICTFGCVVCVCMLPALSSL